MCDLRGRFLAGVFGTEEKGAFEMTLAVFREGVDGSLVVFFDL